MPALQRLQSVLYHFSFTFFLILLATLLVGSAWGLSEQAWRTDHQRRWNMFALIAAYVAIGIISAIHVWSRILSVKKILGTVPKPYMPTKQVDLPKKVARTIQSEYSRTAVIAHISQATAGKHEGWGRPGTRWDGVHFRTYILGTVKEMRHILLENPHPANPSLRDLIPAAERLCEPGVNPTTDPLSIFVASYVAIVERARYARAEPDEADASAVEKVLVFVKNLVSVRRKRLDELPSPTNTVFTHSGASTPGFPPQQGLTPGWSASLPSVPPTIATVVE